MEEQLSEPEGGRFFVVFFFFGLSASPCKRKEQPKKQRQLCLSSLDAGIGRGVCGR